jgi:hypothetical protein
MKALIFKSQKKLSHCSFLPCKSLSN